MTDFSPPRGTQDLLPPVSERLEALADAAAVSARLHGFRRVETPAFEQTELFARGVGESTDIVTKEMYTFEDKGGRSLTLRPEGTAPVVRAYLGNRHDLATPFKAYYIVPMFRHERPQAGRMRQHTQFGAEIIGTDAPAADVEVIELAHRYLSEFARVGFSLRLNSIGDERCRPAYREALVGFLEARRERLPKELRERVSTNPLRVLDAKDDEVRDVTADAPSILDFLDDECRDHFDRVRALLDDEDIAYEIDARLVRGLDYYTRTTFEFVSEVLGPTQSTLCGGGRYDRLAEVLGGEPTPGIGFGLGLERVLLAMEREGTPADRSSTSVFVVALGEDARRSARDLVRSLRRSGVRAESALEDRPLKAQLKMADRAEAVYAALIGDDELGAKEVTMRRMSDGTQERVPVDEVHAWLASR